MIKNKTIFISPLDWGLGHATRCVPLIKQLQKYNTVILGITKTTSLILNEEFPELKKIEIEPYAIYYSKKLPLALKLLVDAPRIFSVIKKEHQQLKNIIKQRHIDVIISDNRFGLYHKDVESIYISHQLTIQAGIFSYLINTIHHHYIKRFNSVWVPDFKEEQKSLAGKLSRSTGLKNVNYIGPLSRLSIIDTIEEKFDYLFLLSGPEPQRTILENKLLTIAATSSKKIALIRGTNELLKSSLPKNCIVVDVATSTQLSQFILQSKIIVCRSGYSTLMDLHALQKKEMVLIPTPGQKEQEYLATYWQEKYGATAVLQRDLYTLKLSF